MTFSWAAGLLRGIGWAAALAASASSAAAAATIEGVRDTLCLLFRVCLLRAHDDARKASRKGQGPVSFTWPSPDHRQPAADAQDLTRDVIGAGAEKEQHRLRDLNRPGEAAERNGADQRLLHALRLALKQRRIGRAGAHAVDVDVVSRHFARQGFGKSDQTAFGGGIDGLAGAADAAGIAGDIDDLAAPGRHH